MEKWWKAMESYGNHTEMDWFKGKKKWAETCIVYREMDGFRLRFSLKPIH
jgi:hypothetical protein